jgi:hypothetical protein
MGRAWWLKALHLIGYLTTAIVLLEAALIGFWSWSRWETSRQADARMREATRTHDRPLGANRADLLEVDADAAYRGVRGAYGPGDEGVGFVSMPSFSSWTAISLWLPAGADVATGQAVIIQNPEKPNERIISPAQAFTLPRAEYRKIARQVDVQTDGWSGQGMGRGSCFDGLVVAFERVRPKRVTSGTGNASCDAHYQALDQIMSPLVTRFALRAKSGQAPPP